MAYPKKSFLLRHQLISFIRDVDLKGIRRLAHLLPKAILPSVENKKAFELKTIHGISLLIDPAKDKGVELSLYQFGTYEKGTIQVMKNLLQKGDSFLDIGANIGLMSAIASKQIGENGMVYAFEPNPITAKILAHNLTLNQANNVSVFQVALSNEDGTAVLFENWNVNRGGASLLSQGEKEGFSVEVKRLDSLFSETHPLNLVKIDVEGLELEVLKGGKKWFETQKPHFIVEVSSMRENEKGISATEVLEFIETLGEYHFFKLSKSKERKGKLVQINNWSELPAHDNVFCISKK